MLFQPKSTLRRRAQAGVGVLACAAGAALFAASGAPSASAASDTKSTTANVGVSSAITLSGLTSSFTLTGAPGTTQTGTAAVTMNVTTNNLTGYTVTVQGGSATLAGTGTNTDTIPISALKVRESVTGTYAALSSTTPRTVHSQALPSLPTGDTISNDYQIVVPFVNPDTYSQTLTYVAATQ